MFIHSKQVWQPIVSHLSCCCLGGRRVQGVPPSLLGRNRSRAGADGLQAQHLIVLRMHGINR